MEGAMFYWIFWVLWIYFTFILNKQNPYRMKLAAVVLMVIILSDVHFKAGNFEVFAGGVFLLLISYFIISREKRGAMIYFFICSFIVSIAYVTFHLFEIFDPIWVIFKKEWMMGICFGFLSILLQKTLKGRLLIMVTGTMQGEFLYAYILRKYQFPYSIGDFSYLDVCSLTLALLVGWSCLENAGPYFQTYFHSIEKGKQKSS